MSRKHKTVEQSISFEHVKQQSAECVKDDDIRRFCALTHEERFFKIFYLLFYLLNKKLKQKTFKIFCFKNELHHLQLQPRRWDVSAQHS